MAKRNRGSLAPDRRLIWAQIIQNEENQCRVITLKRYYDDFSYHVEYVFFTEDFEILETYRESEGVNPSFILAPTKEIWVVMSATRECYPFGKDVTLPLFKRSRFQRRA